MFSTRQTLISLACAVAVLTPAAASALAPSTPPAAQLTAVNGDGVERAINLRADDKGNVDAKSVPAGANVFTFSELKRIFPTLSATTTYSDTVTLTFPKEDASHRSTLNVRVVQTGKQGEVSKRWSNDRDAHQKRSAENPGLYDFLGKGSNGVEDAYTDGTTTRVLLTNSGAATYLAITGIGMFDGVDDHAAARKQFRSKDVPALVELLGNKVKAGNAGYNKKKTDSPSK